MAPPPQNNCVQPSALPFPILNKLRGKRVVLASASPRRKEILESIGLTPEIVPSTFAEDLPHASYAHDLAEYPVATAGEKAREVYERLVAESPDDAPDLVISADTVVIFPPLVREDEREELALDRARRGESVILEKPASKADNLRMLLDMNGEACQVTTAIVIAYPTLSSPGYALRSLVSSTLLHFADSPPAVLKAYAATGEGLDKAGGFALQGRGMPLVRSIEGEWGNVVGFGASAFLAWMGGLLDDEAEDLLEL